MMKTKLILTLGVSVLMSIVSYAQCDAGTVDGCAKKLGGDFTFLKSMTVDLKKVGSGKDFVEYSNVLSKGNTYMLKACEDASPDMIIELYDNTRKLIATNVNNGKVANNYVALKCANTSIYYIKFKFPEGNSSSCGVGVLGFK